jgi:hypothetical protein
MSVLLFSILSLLLSGLSYIRVLNWLCLVGFGFAMTGWVMGRKLIHCGVPGAYARPAMILGVIGTFLNLFTILISFVLGSLLVGGFVVF